MNYSDVQVRGSSTFARQVARDAANLGALPGNMCSVIRALANANNAAHGGQEDAATSDAAPEWNEWAASNGCPQPYEGRGRKGHADIAPIDAAFKAALAGEPESYGADQQGVGSLAGGPSASMPSGGGLTSGYRIDRPNPGSDEPNGGTDWIAIGAQIWGVLSQLRNLFGGGPEGWTKGTDITIADRLRAAQSDNGDVTGIAPLTGAALSGLRRGFAQANGSPNNVPEWAYTQNGGETWGLAYNFWPDQALPASGVNRSAGIGDVGTGTTTGGGGGQTSNEAIAELLGPGVPPRTYQVRRCGPKMRLAFNGQCYDERLLPHEFYMNEKRKAPVPHGAKKRIAKAKREIKAIQRYAKGQGLVHHEEHRHYTHTHHRRRR